MQGIPLIIGSSQQTDNSLKLEKLNSELLRAINQNDKYEVKEAILSEIDEIITKSYVSDSLVLTDAYYLTGTHLIITGRNKMALDRFLIAKKMKNIPGYNKTRYAYCLSNIATSYYQIGDYSKAYECFIKSIEFERSLVGSDSASLASGYVNLASTSLQLNDYEKAMSNAETGIEIIRLFPGKVDTLAQAALYHDVGICYDRKSELAKALTYFKQALILYNSIESTVSDEPKQLLYIAIADSYRSLDQPEEAEKIYKAGLSFISEKYLLGNYVIFIVYADFLLEAGKVDEGRIIFEKGLEQVKEVFGVESKEYYRMLIAQANFIFKATGDERKASELYAKCLSFLEVNKSEYALRNSAVTGYARILIDTKKYSEAVELLDNLLEPDKIQVSELVLEFNGGSVVGLSPQYLRKVLELKYEALNALTQLSGSPAYAMQAIETGKSLIAFYDLLRANMSEEASRNYLSANAHIYYTGIIKNFASLYADNHDPALLEGAYQYIEKSKVAAFLASMRDLNAARFSLPADLVTRDNDIQKRVGLYRELIINESEKSEPDSQKIAIWEKKTFSLLRSKDSLISVFENNFPDYYRLKFKNDITPSVKIKKIIGNETNYLSYALSDSLLFIFVSNRRHEEILTCNVDSSFYIHFERFRKLLSELPAKSSAHEYFNEYMDLGYKLYKVLLEPAEPYLTGDKVVISPDNVLSYLPFETLITNEYRSDDLLYREAPFALKKYRFSYIYSVTLSSELKRNTRSVRNKLVAFAPSYDDMEIPDSLLWLYPNLRGRISRLPYAVTEAEDAVKQCGGKSYVNKLATEEAYKNVAPQFSIVHMAMHTLINDQYPGYSKMIFSDSVSGRDDGFLNTYEVYSNPLNAMMVVLSSCNTGSGIMMTGEGILSLARGFLFAGSQSVVMSMWEVEDYSGASIVKSFYHFLRKGQSKSAALRSARLDFLNDADQVRSHPYYWATLVVYGDDSSLYFNKAAIISGIILFIITASALLFLIYKGPRS